MSNVPWHEEVVGFVKQIAEELPDYEIASEHEHSNCILLAHKRVSYTFYGENNSLRVASEFLNSQKILRYSLY
jgi:wyosine [tRNA(Phe)-imidazoG37] synthetase (radical SAM superfamily)